MCFSHSTKLHEQYNNFITDSEREKPAIWNQGSFFFFLVMAIVTLLHTEIMDTVGITFYAWKLYKRNSGNFVYVFQYKYKKEKFSLYNLLLIIHNHLVIPTVSGMYVFTGKTFCYMHFVIQI